MKNIRLVHLIYIIFGFFISIALVFSNNFQIGMLLSYPIDGTGSINYYRPSYSGGIQDGQNINIGWRTFGIESFDIYTPEYCKRITQSGITRNQFIATKTTGEWESFKNRTYSGNITISSCSSGTGCDINSGYVCGTMCPPLALCSGTESTFNNECEMVSAGYYYYNAGACGGGCNPLSGPVSGQPPCPKGFICTDGLPACQIYENECVMMVAGATYCLGGPEI